MCRHQRPHSRAQLYPYAHSAAICSLREPVSLLRMQNLIDAHISSSYRDTYNLTLRGVAHKFDISVEVMGKLYPAGARLAYVALSGKAASFTSFPQLKTLHSITLSSGSVGYQEASI